MIVLIGGEEKRTRRRRGFVHVRDESGTPHANAYHNWFARRHTHGEAPAGWAGGRVS